MEVEVMRSALSIQEIKAIVDEGNPANIKYVRVGNEFRYAPVAGPIEHKHLVAPHETPKSAGFFTLFRNNLFYLHTMPSTSLRLGPHDDDEQLLKDIFLT